MCVSESMTSLTSFGRRERYLTLIGNPLLSRVIYTLRCESEQELDRTFPRSDHGYVPQMFIKYIIG